MDQGASPSGGAKQVQVAQDASGSAPWLARLNGYREAAGLQTVKENRAFSQGDALHARYLIKNQVGFSAGASVHSEEPGNPWYSQQGLEAAQTSDVIPPGSSPFSDDDAIDMWLSGPFHALPMLAPDLGEVGFGRYCEKGVCAAALKVGRDESWFRNPAHLVSRSHLDLDRQPHDNPNVFQEQVAARQLSSPIEFPPDGAVISEGSFRGGEWPNPLASCPGYQTPTGHAVILQLGAEVAPDVSTHSFSRDGKELEHCIFDASTYTNPDPSQSHAAKGNLNLYGAIVLIPREPLTPGAKYSVSITVRDTTYEWSFSVASKAPEVYMPETK
jgi:cysteine-rich secretory family protein